jgi:predicted DCC family thiol-disulfide oxidoreductase YuxK
MSTTPVTLFYDGLCPLCSREVAHYRKHTPEGAILFVDITEPAFDAAAHGFDLAAAHRRLHARVGDEIVTGVAAIVAVWEAIPRYRWAARLGRLAGVSLLLSLGYAVFVRIRPLLPRRKMPLCEAGTCHR